MGTTAKELRSYQGSQQVVEYRADGDERTVSGTAVVYGQLSEDFGGWREKIAPGAFQNLRSTDLLLLNNHDTSQVLARSSANTLTVQDTASGLQFSASLGNESFAQDVGEMIRRRSIQGCSFGFICLDDRWDNNNGQITRTVLSAELFELTLTASPAYTQTSAQVRSAALATCPVEIRSIFDNRAATGEDCDPDEVDDCEDDEEDRCDCGLDDCEQCAAQDEARKDALRIRSLFGHRMTNQV